MDIFENGRSKFSWRPKILRFDQLASFGFNVLIFALSDSVNVVETLDCSVIFSWDIFFISCLFKGTVTYIVWKVQLVSPSAFDSIFRLALDLDLKCQPATSIVCDTDYEHPMRAFLKIFQIFCPIGHIGRKSFEVCDFWSLDLLEAIQGITLSSTFCFRFAQILVYFGVFHDVFISSLDMFKNCINSYHFESKQV